MNSHKIELYSATYSEKEKMILFLPGKTGTIHAAFVFNHFDFSTRLFDKATDKLVYDNNAVVHNHSMTLPKEFEDYSIICTARNPYDTLVSSYYHELKNNFDNNSRYKNFKEYFAKNSNSVDFYHKNGFFFKKKPDYFLRAENLYYDYIQIPFIRNSKLNKTGLLYELCNKRIHSNKNNVKFLEEYYTEDMADYVYTEFKEYFEILGYDKDSWKIPR
jgi:hypothetical protein